MKSPLEEIAYAALDVEDLARGVLGTVTVEGLDSVRQAQAVILSEGWKREPECEGWSKLEHRVYSRGKNTKKRWMKITVGRFLGVFGLFEVVETKPF
jgi:hypothetical protein